MYNHFEIDAEKFPETPEGRREFVDSRGWAAIGGIRVINSSKLTKAQRDEISRFFWFEIDRETVFR